MHERRIASARDSLPSRAPSTPLYQGLCLCLCVTGLLVSGGSAAAEEGSRARTQWWNDPVIVREISLTSQQRTQMDAAFERYSEKLDASRRDRSLHNEFLETLEKGDWARGRELLDQMSSRAAGPHEAMNELKLEVLPLLSDAQREGLLERYPRVIKRQWRPAVGWSRKRGDGRGEKVFQGGRRGGPGHDPPHGPGHDGPGPGPGGSPAPE